MFNNASSIYPLSLLADATILHLTAILGVRLPTFRSVETFCLPITSLSFTSSNHSAFASSLLWFPPYTNWGYRMYSNMCHHFNVTLSPMSHSLKVVGTTESPHSWVAGGEPPLRQRCRNSSSCCENLPLTLSALQPMMGIQPPLPIRHPPTSGPDSMPPRREGSSPTYLSSSVAFPPLVAPSNRCKEYSISLSLFGLHSKRFPKTRIP